MNISTFTQWLLIAIIGTLIWLAVFSLSYHTFSINVPVNFTNLKSTLAVSDDDIGVDVILRAKQLIYYKIRNGNALAATVDLAHIKKIGNYSVKPKIEVNAAGVWVVGHSPEILDLKITSSFKKEVPVVVDIVGIPKVGYAVDAVKIKPQKVLIVGPQSVVSNQSAVYLTVDVNERSTSYTNTGVPRAIKANGSFYQNISTLPRNIDIDVSVIKGETFKTVGVVPQFKGNLPPGYWIKEVVFSESAITIKSSAHRLVDIGSVSTTPIDLNNKTKDFTDQVGLETLSDVQVVGSSLINVTVKIGVSEYNRQLIIAPQAVNIPPALKLTRIAPATATITVTGPPNILAELGIADIDLKVDVNTATSGITNFVIAETMFTLPVEIELLSFIPESLNFSFSKK
ncbi:MAG: CdaR family protein [Patescibacteria group bacterium]|nr:CdaR family protein [Patescibacteria group bacterium]